MSLVNQGTEIYTLSLKRIILSWLQDFFAGRADYPYVLGNDRDTGIKIHDKQAFNMPSVGDRPAVVLDRKQFRWVRSSIDQNLGYSGLGARQAKMDLLQGQVILHCLSKKDLVAEQVAHTVFFGISVFDLELRRRGLWDIKPVAIGEETIIAPAAGTEIVSVPVICTVFVQGKWLRRQASTHEAAKACVDVDIA